MKTVLLIAALFVAGDFALAANVNVTKNQVEFLAVGKPSAIKIRGQGQSLKNQLQWSGGKLSGSFHFDLDSLNTGIELRDKHMKEKYLETGKFKTAELQLQPVDLPKELCTSGAGNQHLPFAGTLKLHGIEKPVKGELDLQGGKGQGSATAQFDLNLSDYQIEIPAYMGIKVADRVENKVVLDWVCAP